MKDKIKNNKKIIILAFVVVVLVGASIYAISNSNSNTASETTTKGTAKVVGDLKITDITSKIKASGNSSDPTYYYGIGGIIENLSISGYDSIDDGSYVVEVKYHDSNGNIVEIDTVDYISKESAKKSSFDRTSFQYSFTLKEKISIGKVEIKLLDKNGNELASTTYQFNNNAYEDDTEDISPDDTSSSSSSDSSSTGTFEDGFKDGASDAWAGRSPIYSGDPIIYADPYQAGYADGYQNYLSYPEYK